MLPLTLLALVVGSAEQAFALRSSNVPEDLFAYPKYSIHFLNGQPVLNDTAQRWLQDGVVDQDEFLGHKTSSQDASKLFKSIAGGPEDAELAPAAASPPNDAPSHPPTLQKMKLGSSDYLCLLPSPPDVPSSDDDSQQAPQPIRAWELLQPLEGTCLYHRQGWFSYAYCHGRHVRQFRELEPNLPFGLKTPAEDPNEPAYMLGHAPTPAATTPNDDDQGKTQHLSVADRTALANRLELARGAGQRYLNLHMGDGTVCDKSGQPRQVNVQFHCGAGPRDVIAWIKEHKTCSYTLLIHTPRLCNEPGFKDPRDDLPDTPLHCRKIVDTLDGTDPTLPASSSPFERRKPKPLPAPRKERAKGKDKDGGGKMTSGADDKINDAQAKMIRAAFDALLGRKDSTKGNNNNQGGTGEGKSKGEDLADKIVAVSIDEDGEIQFLDSLGGGSKDKKKADKNKDNAAAPTLRNDQLGDDEGDVMEIELADGEDAARLMKILQDAGFDARFPGADDDEKEGKHDEL